jgi:hypothetical protein
MVLLEVVGEVAHEDRDGGGQAHRELEAQDLPPELDSQADGPEQVAVT